MQHIHVTCGIIERDGLVLAARRGKHMSMPLKWEFPGGKINAGETPEACLYRELGEELSLTVRVEEQLPLSRHRYPSFSITLYPFICRIEAGEPVAREHAETAWLRPDELPRLDWAPADIPVLEEYLRLRGVSCEGSER